MALPYNSGDLETMDLFNDRFQPGPAKGPPAGADSARSRPSADATDATLLLLEDGHCLRDHALSACRLDAKSHAEALPGRQPSNPGGDGGRRLGVTLLPQLAIDGGILAGSNLVTRPMAIDEPWREIALVWRKGTGRREEFQLLAKEIRKLAKASWCHKRYSQIVIPEIARQRDRPETP